MEYGIYYKVKVQENECSEGDSTHDLQFCMLSALPLSYLPCFKAVTKAVTQMLNSLIKSIFSQPNWSIVMQDSPHTCIPQLLLGLFCMPIGQLVQEKKDLITALKHLGAMLDLIAQWHSTWNTMSKVACAKPHSSHLFSCSIISHS